MKILEERNVTILKIEYSNDKDLVDRDKVFGYLAGRFGEIGYSVKRMGLRGCRPGIGLIIAETDAD